MFRVLIEWLRQPRVKNWNNAFLAKQRWMKIWQEWKKCNSLIGETKNRLENLKQNYFTSWLPRNLNEKHDILMFLFLKISDLKILFFRFIHRVSAFTLSLPDYDTKELFNVQFPPTISIYSSANSFGE